MLFDNGTGAMTDETISTESVSCILEAAMCESFTSEEIADFVADPDATGTAVSEGVLMEKSIVRLDKKAKLQSAYKSALFVIAKENNDRDFKKLVTIWKTERALEAKIEKKYKNEAMRRAKLAMKEAKKSKLPILNKLADKSTKK